MKKILEEMILKWHEDGITLEETARLVPQVPKAEIAAIIHQHDERSRN
ncbi:antitoxin [Bifidobacterium pseudocatenulatum]|nr:antitoxin [Bifidobacterium pseudocatenulatum]MCB4890581.1 antitoxin [Bifidobacterium pseudocatenulatum]